MKPQRHSSFNHQVVFALVLLLASCAATLGQGAARPNRGVMPTGSYSVSDIENISLTNGNLSLGIALASLPPVAGGKLGTTLRAQYNSKQWDTVRTEVQSDPIDPATKHTISNLQQSNVGGWRVGAGYSISFENAASDYSWLTPSDDPEYNLLTSNDWTRVVLTTPDGATHELRPVDYFAYGDGYLNHNYLRGYYKDNPHTVNGSVRYYSFDGSHLWAKIDSTQYCCYFAQSWTLYLPDGTKVEQLIGGDQRIIDTNGNKVKIFTTETAGVSTQHYQDEQTGRELKYVYDPAGNSGQGLGQVQYQTVGGTWVTIDINFGTTRVFGKSYEFGDQACSEAAYNVDTPITVIRSIVYPQTEPGEPRKQFTFTYNSDTTDAVNYQWRPDCWGGYQTVTSASHGWGSLSQIVMPTGAAVNYAYSLDTEHYLSSNPDAAPRESMNVKTLIHDGTTDTWQYFNTPATGGFTGPDGSFVVETRYSSDPGFAHTYSGFGGKEELVYRTKSSDKVMVERHWTLMPFTGGDNIAPGANVQVAFNPVVDAEYTSLLDDTPSHNPVKMSAKTFQYDYNGNLLTETDYDWFDPSLVSRDAQGVPTGVPAGAIVLRVSSNVYHNPATSSSSGNVYAKRSLSTGLPLILNALQQTTTGPAIAQLSYDGYSYGATPTVGNLTSQSVWDDLDSKWITSSQTYGAYGNLATKTDPRGKVTQFFYDDATHAVPNRVVVDPQNGTGTQTTSTAFDYSTGLVTSQTDANLIVSTIDYTNQLLGGMDPFGRPGIIKGPLVNGQQHWVTTKYVDRLRQMIQASDLTSQNDQLLKTKTTSDQLGRAILTEQTEDGTNYSISASNVYEQMGKISYSSNPARAAGASTDGWSRATNDTAGRVIEVATFSGATKPAATGYTNGTGQVSTAYDANFTTVTDQAGKSRRSMVDALGRLVRIDEPITGNNLGSTASPTQPTSYTYSVLGNLLTVTQGVQTRTFTYDSLSRLRTAVNPESGTISYQYDDNSNLTQKTDALSIGTTITYDALNRPTLKNYSETTPDVAYFYDTQTLPAGAPTFDRGYAKGRLVGVTYGGGSAGTYRGYDARGSVLRQYQRTDSVDYLVEATYKLSGGTNTETYPSVPGAGDRRIVSYTNDSAGRLASLSSSATSYAPAASVSGIGYSAPGGLSSETYGNNLIHGVTYNSRLQANEIKLGTSGAPSSNVSITYTYGTTANNGNLLSTSYAGGGLSYTQTFGYDELNRLTTSQEGASWSQTNSYDKYGNRSIVGGALSFTASNNRITGWSYDTAGNLLNDGAHAYTFDAENKISKVDGISAYVYNGDGQRVRKLVNENLRFIYGIGGQQIAEFDGSTGALKKEYVYGASGLVATIEPPAVNANGTRYTTSDHLGSPRVVTNSSAGVASRHDYMPFGEELFNGGRTFGMGYGTTDGIRQKFTSKERDNETGLDYFLARYYSSTQGRFTSPDPIIISDKQTFNPQLWNLYNYAGNNPLLNTDPTGMEVVQLGQNTDEEIKKRQKEIENQLKNKNLAKDQKKALKAEKKTLDLEKQGNKVAGEYLAALDKIGERNGLQLTDFSLTTDPVKDFASDASFITAFGGDKKKAEEAAKANGGTGMFVWLGFSTQIFLNATSNDYRGSRGQIPDTFASDYITYGGTAARHEKAHFGPDNSEHYAYGVQLSILQKFGPTAFKSKAFYDNAIQHVTAGSKRKD